MPPGPPAGRQQAEGVSAVACVGPRASGTASGAASLFGQFHHSLAPPAPTAPGREQPNPQPHPRPTPPAHRSCPSSSSTFGCGAWRWTAATTAHWWRRRWRLPARQVQGPACHALNLYPRAWALCRLLILWCRAPKSPRRMCRQVCGLPARRQRACSNHAALAFSLPSLQVGCSEIVGRIVEDLKDESEPYRWAGSRAGCAPGRQACREARAGVAEISL